MSERVGRTERARVAIGMPLYNAERYLEQTLDSILSQTFADFELIISDNASTDRTREICERYAADDARISYSRNERNMGATYNYNRTFALSDSPYFKHAAYDDLLAPTYLERLVEVLDRDCEVVLAFPICVPIDGEGDRLQDAPLLSELVLPHSTAHARLRAYVPGGGPERMCDPVFGLFRASALRRTGMLGNYMSADSVLLGEIALHGKLEQVPEELFFERYHAAGSVMSNPTLDDRFAWFDPALHGRWHNRLFAFRWTLELCRAINRAPISLVGKMRCYAVMRHYLQKHRRSYFDNVVWTVAFFINKAGRRWLGPQFSLRSLKRRRISS